MICAACVCCFPGTNFEERHWLRNAGSTVNSTVNVHGSKLFMNDFTCTLTTWLHVHSVQKAPFCLHPGNIEGVLLSMQHNEAG